MEQLNIEGMIQRPDKEIEQKLECYFKSNGFKEKCYFDRDGIDGDYAFEIRGTFDDIRIVVAYKDFKPQKKVLREIMALDERISDVDCTRQLSDASYRRKACELCIEPIYVLIDGVMQQTTWYDYVNYSARNIDYTKEGRFSC